MIHGNQTSAKFRGSKNFGGQPLTRPALSHLMRAAIKEAGLPAKCVSHGLRKAAMRRLAEHVSGHKTLREVERYTAAADQKRLAKSGMDKIRGKKRTWIA
jgi:hypothetical protein